MTSIRLRPGCQRRLEAGHLWVFSNEIRDFDPAIPTGEDVAVEDHRGRLLGSGTFNPASLIAVRLHAPGSRQPLDAALLAERVGAAWERRRAWLGADAAGCRVVYAEADGLPGLIVDRFGGHLAVQLLTAAMQRRREAVLAALEETLAPQGVVLRNDAPARSLEGLDRGVEVVGEVPARVPFHCAGLSLVADLVGGQKTGFFFDHRENYALLRNLAPGARVLDAFCYSGAWGIAAARWGAAAVTGLDASHSALELAAQNAAANGAASFEPLQGDVLTFLKDRVGAGETLDLIILDPPAFAKSRRHVPEALRGYLNLNKWGLRAVRPGGHLVTCSCSYQILPEVFVETVARAAREAGRRVRVVAVGRQGPDHPWLPAMPETAYLKVLLLQVD